MIEIWKSIPGFNRYEASNTGKLRSLSYKNTGKNRKLLALKYNVCETTLKDIAGGRRNCWSMV